MTDGPITCGLTCKAALKRVPERRTGIARDGRGVREIFCDNNLLPCGGLLPMALQPAIMEAFRVRGDLKKQGF